jgi:hypothetical protein
VLGGEGEVGEEAVEEEEADEEILEQQPSKPIHSWFVK